MRTVEWVDGELDVVDQTALPRLCRVRLRNVDEVVDAVRRLVVRGAPLLGVVGALGVALAASGRRCGRAGPGGCRADRGGQADSGQPGLGRRAGARSSLPQTW